MILFFTLKKEKLPFLYFCYKNKQEKNKEIGLDGGGAPHVT